MSKICSTYYQIKPNICFIREKHFLGSFVFYKQLFKKKNVGNFKLNFL